MFVTVVSTATPRPCLVKDGYVQLQWLVNYDESCILIDLLCIGFLCEAFYLFSVTAKCFTADGQTLDY